MPESLETKVESLMKISRNDTPESFKSAAVNERLIKRRAINRTNYL